MPARRRPQSFRGLVREYLAYIEHELERGIDHATVRSELGVESATPSAFRNALYHARRRARNRPIQTTQVPQVSRSAPNSRATITPPGHPSVPSSRPVPPANSRSESPPLSPARATWSAAIQTPRDFLELVRSTNDSEIF